MPPVNPAIFRAYDVRGVYGKDITEKTAELIGKAFGTFIGEGKKIVVGRDVRLSGERLKKNLILGLISVGCDVIDADVVTTPMIYFAVTNYRFDGGIEVTASHNPADWNGFKMTKEKGILCSEGLGREEIMDIFLRGNFRKTSTIGRITKMDTLHDYQSFILEKIKIPKKLKIVLDPGNGAACGVAEELFRKAGHEVVVINGNPDGSFPSRPSDPLEENVNRLKEEVLNNQADMGIAFDGDVDRLAFVDNLGRYVRSGNVTIPIFSEYYLSRQKNAKIVFDICCSSFVEEFVKSKNGVPLVNKVGHSFIMNRIINEGAVFGGEYSNHLYFSEIFGFDDALFAGLKMSEIVSSQRRTFAEIVDSVPIYPASKVIEIPCRDDIKFQIVKKVGENLKNEGFRIIGIDGVKAFDKDDNWILIRGSNTLPAIKINSEAKTEKRMRELFDLGVSKISEEVGRT